MTDSCKSKFNPVNAEYLTKSLSMKTSLPYQWSFGNQGTNMDALVNLIKAEDECTFRDAKSVHKWIKSLTNETLPALYKAVQDFEGNILNMDEVEEEVTYEGKKTTTLELLNGLNLLKTMNICVPTPKSRKQTAIDDHYTLQNKILQKVMKNLLRMYAPYAKFQAEVNLKSQQESSHAQMITEAGNALMRGKDCSSDEDEEPVDITIYSGCIQDEDEPKTNKKRRYMVGENSKKQRKKTEGPLTSASAVAIPQVSYQVTLDKMMQSLENKNNLGSSTQMQEQAWTVLQNPENFINLEEYNNIQSMLETAGATSSFLLVYLPGELIDEIASKLKLLPRRAVLSLK